MMASAIVILKKTVTFLIIMLLSVLKISLHHAIRARGMFDHLFFSKFTNSKHCVFYKVSHKNENSDKSRFFVLGFNVL